MAVRFALAVAILGWFQCTLTFANFRAEFAVVKGGHSAEMPGMSRLELDGDKMRMDADNISLLTDARSGKMTVLMHDRREFIDMRKVAAAASAAVATANALGGADLEVSVKPMGTRDRVGNFACEVFRAQADSEHHEDVCLANFADVGISSADQVTLRRTFDEMKAMSENVTDGLFQSPLHSMPSNRFPVRMTRYEEGKVVQVVELKSLTSGGASGRDFAVPAGYSEAGLGSLLDR